MAQSERLFSDEHRLAMGENPEAVLPLEHRALTLGRLSVQATVYLPPNKLLTDDGGGLFYDPSTKIGRDSLVLPESDTEGHNFVALTLLADEEFARTALISDVRYAQPGSVPEITGNLESTGKGTYTNPERLNSSVFWHRVPGIVFGGQSAAETQFNGPTEWRNLALQRATYIDEIVAGRISESDSPDGGRREPKRQGLVADFKASWHRLWSL